MVEDTHPTYRVLLLFIEVPLTPRFCSIVPCATWIYLWNWRIVKLGSVSELDKSRVWWSRASRFSLRASRFQRPPAWRASLTENFHGVFHCWLILWDPGADCGADENWGGRILPPPRPPLFLLLPQFPVHSTICPWVSEDLDWTRG